MVLTATDLPLYEAEQEALFVPVKILESGIFTGTSKANFGVSLYPGPGYRLTSKFAEGARISGNGAKTGM